MVWISLHKYAGVDDFIGTRECAAHVRSVLVNALDQGEEVVLDFSGVRPTEDFIDELVGPLLVEHGESILPHLIMKSCSNDIKINLQHVVSHYLEQHARMELEEKPLPHGLIDSSLLPNRVPSIRSSLVD